MTTFTATRAARGLHATLGNYCIRLKVLVADHEDAWDLCQEAIRYEGVEIRDCCFAFASEERRAAASEAMRVRFGPQYFEEVDMADNRAG